MNSEIKNTIKNTLINLLSGYMIGLIIRQDMFLYYVGVTVTTITYIALKWPCKK